MLIRRSLDMTIGSFEAEDITSVIAVEEALETTRLAHKFLSEHFELDPFEHILNGECEDGIREKLFLLRATKL